MKKLLLILLIFIAQVITTSYSSSKNTELTCPDGIEQLNSSLDSLKLIIDEGI